MTKTEVRQLFLAKRLLLSEEEFDQKCEQLSEKLLLFILDNRFEQILLFYPIEKKREWNNLSLIEELWNHKIDIFLPLSDFKSKKMSFHRYKKHDILVEKKYGIFEPKKNNETPEYNKKTLVVVPVLAHDSYGNRIGYGAGFYDIFLSQNSAIESVGVNIFPPTKLQWDVFESDYKLKKVIFA